MAREGIHTPVRVRRTMHHQAVAAYAVLADLRNHWLLSDAFEVRDVTRDQHGQQTGANVRVNGPLGLRRAVRTRLQAAVPVERIEGTAVAGRTRAHVEWRVFEITDRRCTVELSVRMLKAGPVERLLFALGARRWLTRRFRDALLELDRLVLRHVVRAAQTEPVPAEPARSRVAG